MKKNTTKQTKRPEVELLNLLKKVLPKATDDAALAGKIYEAIASELHRKTQASAFSEFCRKVEVKEIEPKCLEELQQQLTETFKDADLALKPNKKEKTIAVELALPDGTQLTGNIRVNPNATEETDDEEPAPKFVPFPVCLPGDTELVWMLAKWENLSPEEAGMALTKIQEEFWGSKTGQKLLRDRVERTFPEFISRVPAGMLAESGLKRHYKMPEPLKVLRAGPPA